MENNAKDKGHLQNFTFPFWNSAEAYIKCVFIPSFIPVNHQLAIEFMHNHTSQTSEVRAFTIQPGASTLNGI